MRDIKIDDATYDRLVVAARLMDRTVGEVVARLVDRLAQDDSPRATQSDDEDARAGQSSRDAARQSSAYKPPPRVPTDPTVEWIPIFKVFKGNRVEGTFNPRTHEVRLSTPPWANKVFPSPTNAAVAVVEHFAGAVRESNNTNGRKFWKVKETGKNLHSIIGER